jgi:hypothetical protein
MSGAAAFIWILVVVLALAWALMQTGTIRGVNLDMWINVLLILAVLGAVFNLFVMPFIGRSRTTRTSAAASGTSAPAASAPVAPAVTTQPAAGAAEQEVVQETRDKPTL